MNILSEVFENLDNQAVIVVGYDDGIIKYMNPTAIKHYGKSVINEHFGVLGYANGITEIKESLGTSKSVNITFLTRYGESLRGNVIRMDIECGDCIAIFVSVRKSVGSMGDDTDRDKLKKQIYESFGTQWRSIFVIVKKTAQAAIIRSTVRNHIYSEHFAPANILAEKVKERYVLKEDWEAYDRFLDMDRLCKEELSQKEDSLIVKIRDKDGFRYGQIKLVDYGKYYICAEKDIHEFRLSQISSKNKDDIIEAMARVYHSLFIIDYNTGSFRVLGVPDQYKVMVARHILYENGMNEYCDKCVCDDDRQKVKKFATLSNVVRMLYDNPYAEMTFRTRDDGWMAARFVEVKNENGTGKEFILGMVSYDKEFAMKQQTNRINEIISSLSEAYQAVFRVNLRTGAYEKIIMNFDEPDRHFENFFQMEKFFKSRGVNVMGAMKFRDIDTATVYDHMENDGSSIETFYMENTGRWLKLFISKDRNYTKENPYVIYALNECGEQIVEKTHSVIANTALSKMYILVMTIDNEKGEYECILSDDSNSIKPGKGKLENFINMMKTLVYEEDYEIFESLITTPGPDMTGFVEREYRAEDVKGMVHYINAFSTYIEVPEGGRTLLLVRNIDERAANRVRMSSLNKQFDMIRSMLYALGDSYFGIYYINLDTGNVTIARGASDTNKIIKSKINYSDIMKEYIMELVYDDDKEKIADFTSVAFLKDNLKKEGDAIFCEFLRLFDGNYRWVRLDIQAIHCKNDGATEVVLAFKDIHEERKNELKNKKE